MQPGERLEVTLPQKRPSSEHIVPTPMSLSILYEDEDLMVINKASECSHPPFPGQLSPTLWPTGWPGILNRSSRPFVFRAVNRLDRDTTGLLIVAKNALSSCILSDMVRKRQIHRTYLAAVNGNLSGSAGRND